MAAVADLAPLYLVGCKPIKVSLQGVALVVAEEGKAERLYPLRRLERISATVHSQWRTDALLACAVAGISVRFVDAEGGTLGRLVGAGGNDGAFHTRLVSLLNLPDWRDKYAQWCWAQSLQTMRYVGIKLGFRCDEARQLHLLVPWCEARICKRTDKRSAAKALQWLREDCYGLVTQMLQAKGIWESTELGLRDPIDLANDMSHILQWTLLLVRDRCLSDAAVNRRVVAGWFVGETGFLRFQVMRLIQRFETWVAEIC